MPSPGIFEVYIIVTYVIIPIIIFLICQWVFAIDKRVKQQGKHD